MDDLGFVQRCVSGDKLACDEFLKQYSRLIYNYIYSVLKIKGSSGMIDNVKDIFQEIILSLVKDNCRKLKSFKAKNGCSLASWLRIVTINFTIDYLRKTKPALSLEEEVSPELTLKDVLADESMPIPDKISDKERLVQLRDCIDKLSTDDKYFLELHLNQDLRLKELAEILQLSRGAVDMQKTRIIERLRDCFKNKDFTLDL